ncbi:DNA-directed RNA polymerase sigma-70 factor [Paenibacillus baekrokdamisoli]|uniref:DNA-directed RNA polymerase sigma-70 factor n=1 Tax=Paenibacillus baekrokdamisoli TaxID=1712516 RepID=A0A3G9IVJ6_9BACL|nr:sigma-70 family RNA polymerase sigma factor [Paenibacillus baekrokdamisoli]MBB3068116.1 RNA polymerase sigma-70 factor (ECF subfamily) [Paenibacillus baekrokdamisoli]BBH22840.1 DNA-directed RNA polymerase sigma-70 factor [Paenibacillus baekrokdamisoli]
MEHLESQELCEEDGLSDLVQRYADLVLRLALTYLRNMPDAQDACQNVYIKLFKQRKEFHDTEHERAWIIRVTINTCKDMMRNRWRRRLSAIDEAVLILPIEDNESREVVSYVLALPKKYRVVIHLYYYENYKTSEIAELLDRKESTVRSQLKRAKELLRARMLGGMDG